VTSQTLKFILACIGIWQPTASPVTYRQGHATCCDINITSVFTKLAYKLAACIRWQRYPRRPKAGGKNPLMMKCCQRETDWSEQSVSHLARGATGCRWGGVLLQLSNIAAITWHGVLQLMQWTGAAQVMSGVIASPAVSGRRRRTTVDALALFMQAYSTELTSAITQHQLTRSRNAAAVHVISNNTRQIQRRIKQHLHTIILFLTYTVRTGAMRLQYEIFFLHCMQMCYSCASCANPHACSAQRRFKTVFKLLRGCPNVGHITGLARPSMPVPVRQYGLLSRKLTGVEKPKLVWTFLKQVIFFCRGRFWS